MKSEKRLSLSVKVKTFTEVYEGQLVKIKRTSGPTEEGSYKVILRTSHGAEISLSNIGWDCIEFGEFSIYVL